MFDWYSAKAPRPVIGWIGTNALDSYQITIDYPRRTIWWVQQGEPNHHDLDQVGLTLEDEDGAYVVSGIAVRAGLRTVEGVKVGDRLVRIGSTDVQGATRGAIFQALHGTPGTTKTLTLERRGTLIQVRASVTAF
jgi:hypothetical protein